MYQPQYHNIIILERQTHKNSMGIELCSSFSSSCKLEETNRVLTQHLRSTREATLSPDDRYYKSTQVSEAMFLIEREKNINRKKSALEERQRAMEDERAGLVEWAEIESKLRMRWAESYIYSIIEAHRDENDVKQLLQPGH